MPGTAANAKVAGQVEETAMLYICMHQFFWAVQAIVQMKAAKFSKLRNTQHNETRTNVPSAV